MSKLKLAVVLFLPVVFLACGPQSDASEKGRQDWRAQVEALGSEVVTLEADLRRSMTIGATDFSVHGPNYAIEASDGRKFDLEVAKDHGRLSEAFEEVGQQASDGVISLGAVGRFAFHGIIKGGTFVAYQVDDLKSH